MLLLLLLVKTPTTAVKTAGDNHAYGELKAAHEDLVDP